MKPLVSSLTLSLCLCCFIGALTIIADGGELTRAENATPNPMPKQCQPGKTSTSALGWRWKAGTTVRIQYLNGSFNPGELAALTRGVDGWNEALATTPARILFVIDEGDVPSRSGPSILVQRGEPRRRERVGELSFHSIVNGKVRLALTIGPTVTDLEALTSLMTHEIGHSLGLADCYECRRGTTAMAAFKGKNKGNDVFQPSECDRYMVSAGYANSVEIAERLSRKEPGAVSSGN